MGFVRNAQGKLVLRQDRAGMDEVREKPMVPESTIGMPGDDTEGFFSGEGTAEGAGAPAVVSDANPIETIGGNGVPAVKVAQGADGGNAATRSSAQTEVMLGNDAGGEMQGAAGGEMPGAVARITGLDDAAKRVDGKKDLEYNLMAAKNPEMARLYRQDPEAARKYYDIWKSESLGDALNVNKWAEETNEQREKRLKKERMERNLINATSLVGALGNLYTASSSRDGRSVDVADVSKATEEKQKAEQSQRLAALQRLDAARKRNSELMQMAWKEADTRRKEAVEADRWQKAYDEKVASRKAKDKRDEEKAKAAQANAAALQEHRAAQLRETSNYHNGLLAQRKESNRIAEIEANKGGRSKSVKTFTFDGETYEVPTSAWNKLAISQLGTYLPDDYQKRIKRRKNAEDIEKVVGEYTKDVSHHNADPDAWRAFKEQFAILADMQDPDEDVDLSRTFDSDEEDESLDF